MSTSYDPLPVSSTVPSASGVQRRSSGPYPYPYDRTIASSSNQRSNSSPDSRRSSYSGYDPYKLSNQDNYRSTDYYPYADYRNQGGAPYDRYREPPDSGWEQSKSTYSSRDHYNPRHVPSPTLSTTSVNRERDAARGRRTSVSMMATRMFQPNSNWKQTNSHDEHAFHPSASTNYDSNGHHRRDSREQDTYSGNVSRSDSYTDRYYRPATPSTRDTRPIDSRDRYESYKPGYSDDERERGRGREQISERANHYQPYYNNHYDGSSRNGRRSLSRDRSLSRSPRRRPRTRSRSSHSSRSRSRSWSSRSKSRSRSSSRRSRLPQRTSVNDSSIYKGRPSSGTWSRGRGRRQVDERYSSRSRSQESRSPSSKRSRSYSRGTRTRSPSRDSIASSRASSIKPTATRQENENTTSDPPPIDNDLVDRLETTEASGITSSGTLLEPTRDIVMQSDSGPGSAPPALFVTGSSDATGAEVSSLPAVVPKDKPETIPDAHEENENGPSSPVPTEATSGTQPGSEPEVNQLHFNGGNSEDVLMQDSPPISHRPTAFHAPIVPELRPEDIPKMTDATDLRGALRVVVMTRLLAERRTRQQLVEPTLLTNLNLPPGPFPESSAGTSPAVLLDEMTSPENERTQARMGKFAQIRDNLVERFEARQIALKDKVQRLTEEYLDLHERWTAHCAVLDEQAKAKANVPPPAVGPVPVVPPPPVTGRTTRRSAATLGDAVRSDFEMEQIIASLGYDEATDPNQLSFRNIARIPEMISVVKGKVDYVYDDNNLLVEDPVSYYAPQTGINDWTEEEKQIFLDKFAAYPKQFGAIAKFLPNKNTAQCVDYYYLHKKLINFREIVAMNAPGRKGRRGKGGKRKGNALLTDIIQHDAEVHGHSPHTPVGVAAPRARGKRAANIGIELRKPSTRKPSSTSYLDSNPTTATPTPEPEARPRRTRAVLNTNRYSFGTPELEDEVEETDDTRSSNRAKRSRKVKSSATVDDDEAENVESSSTPPPPPSINDGDQTSRKPSSTPDQWSDEDKELFLKLLGQHGDDFKRIAASISSKTTFEVTSYYKANKIELDLESIVAGAPKRSASPSDSERPQSPGVSRPGDSSTSISSNPTPPMASLDPPSEITPSATSVREQTNGTNHSAHAVDFYGAYTETHRYPRYTTSVTSPYGALPMSTMYAPGLISGIPPGTYGSAGFRPSASTPPQSSAPSGAVPGYPANAAYGGLGSHYMPFTFSYQQGAAYPPTSMYPSSASPIAASNVTAYAHSISDPSAIPRPYYHYS